MHSSVLATIVSGGNVKDALGTSGMRSEWRGAVSLICGVRHVAKCEKSTAQVAVILSICASAICKHCIASARLPWRNANFPRTD